jgi:hypothetical protein
VLLFFTFAGVGLEIRYVEDAVRVGVVGALGGEGLDVVGDAVGEGDAGVERVELVVVVVDCVRVGKVDGEDTNALGSCATRRLESGPDSSEACDVLILQARSRITQRPLECGYSNNACWNGRGSARHDNARG